MEGREGRRGNGEGNIGIRADGRRKPWEARLPLADGTTKGHHAATRAEAEAWLAAATRDLDLGEITVRDGRMTLETFLLDWLGRKGKIEESTRRRYRELLTLHVIPTLGHLPLARVDEAQLERLRGALLDACRKRYVTRNVADLAEKPRDAEADAAERLL